MVVGGAKVVVASVGALGSCGEMMAEILLIKCLGLSCLSLCHAKESIHSKVFDIFGI